MRRARQWFHNPSVENTKAPDTMTKTTAPGKGNLISSLVDGGHSPVLDLDFEAVLVPSSTSGHSHLYLDGVTLSTDQYQDLLESLVRVGIIEPGILKQFETKGATFVRPPWIKKPEGLKKGAPYAAKTN